MDANPCFIQYRVLLTGNSAELLSTQIRKLAFVKKGNAALLHYKQ